MFELGLSVKVIVRWWCYGYVFGLELGVGVLSEGLFDICIQYVVRIQTLMKEFSPEGILYTAFTLTCVCVCVSVCARVRACVCVFK